MQVVMRPVPWPPSRLQPRWHRLREAAAGRRFGGEHGCDLHACRLALVAGDGPGRQCRQHVGDLIGCGIAPEIGDLRERHRYGDFRRCVAGGTNLGGGFGLDRDRRVGAAAVEGDIGALRAERRAERGNRFHLRRGRFGQGGYSGLFNFSLRSHGLSFRSHVGLGDLGGVRLVRGKRRLGNLDVDRCRRLWRQARGVRCRGIAVGQLGRVPGGRGAQQQKRSRNQYGAGANCKEGLEELVF